jgi:hypothetical protein
MGLETTCRQVAQILSGHKSSQATLSSKNISFASILPLLQSVIVGPSQSRSLTSYFTGLSSLHNAAYFLRLVPRRMVSGLDLLPLFQLIPTSGKRPLLSSAQPNVYDGIAHRLPCWLGLSRLFYVKILFINLSIRHVFISRCLHTLL